VQGAEPLFFLDYYATGKLAPEAAAAVVKGIADGCVEAGCALLGGETAEMPGLYAEGDYDLAGFAVGAVERARLLPRAVKKGDIALGLASSGVHSNGFSLVRRIVARSGLAWDAPAPFEPRRSLAQALLTPTRIYVKPLLAALRETDRIAALAHVTGGGFPDNLPRVLGKGLGVAPGEMLRTFNCGVGMVVFVAAEGASEAEAALRAAGENPVRIGEIVAAEGEERVIARGTLAL